MAVIAAVTGIPFYEFFAVWRAVIAKLSFPTTGPAHARLCKVTA
jgi:hypothetical protein